MMPNLAKRPAVFLDRDGVINHNDPNYVRSWSQVRIIPGSMAALAQLANSPYAVVIVTNQAGVGHGLIDPAIAESINRQLVAQIQAHGGRIDRVEMCPATDDQDRRRKPNPGMLLDAAAALNLDLGRSWLVGDALSDLQAGLAAGVQPLMVLSGRGQARDLQADARLRNTPVVPDLAAAVRVILQSVADFR